MVIDKIKTWLRHNFDISTDTKKCFTVRLISFRIFFGHSDENFDVK